MFTGIVEDRGKVIRVDYRGMGRRLIIEFPTHLTDIKLGDSININGACLTIADIKERYVAFDISPETIEKTTLGDLKEGDWVNIERALRLTDRLGGHIVTGHIDGIGRIVDKREERDFQRLLIKIPGEILRYVVQKGSIAIDGVSLTVNEFLGENIEITLVPYTLEKTVLKDKGVGSRVNVEADILCKYVERLLIPNGKEREDLYINFLKEHGFIEGE